MNLAELLNDLEVDASDDEGEVSLCPQADKAFDGDTLKPEYRWLEDVKAYLGRGHSDEQYTHYVKRGDEVARWSHSECEWEETR